MDFEIIINKDIMKTECVNFVMGPDYMSPFKSGALFLQFNKNLSKQLIANDLVCNKFIQVNDLLLLNKKSTDEKVICAAKLIKQIAIPDWKIKKMILTRKKSEIQEALSTEFGNIKKFIKIHLGVTLPNNIQIYLIYSPDTKYGLGGSRLELSAPAISLRVSNNTKISAALPLITHELLHLALDYSKQAKKLSELDEEALFDLLMYKIEKKAIDWDKIKSGASNYRGHEKNINTIYKMIKPILTGKDELVWKYIKVAKLQR